MLKNKWAALGVLSVLIATSFALFFSLDDRVPVERRVLRSGEAENELGYYDFLTGDYELTGHDGGTLTPDAFKGEKIVLVYFGYVACPDFCPLTLARTRELFEKLGKEASRVQTLFVGFDTENDDVERLREYARFFHPDFLGATGTEEQLKRAALNFGVQFFKNGEFTSDGKPIYTHTDRLFLVDLEGKVRNRYEMATESAQLEKDLAYLLGSHG